MILTLPLLLLASLVSFFAALLISISSVDWAVACPLYIILIATLLVLLFTTFSPGLVMFWYVVTKIDWPEHVTFPPFHSLQSWIVLQMLVRPVRIFARITGYKSTSFSALLSAPDWVAVDRFWADWTGSPAQRHTSVHFPLALCFWKEEDKDAVFHCYNDLFPTHTVIPGRRQLDVYRRIVERLPVIRGPTLLQVQDQLIRHLASLLNSGKHLEHLGPLHVEKGMDHYCISPGNNSRLHPSRF